MVQEHHIAFGPFRLDATHGRLWRGADVIALRPRSLAVLRYLAAHPGRLVTKAELQQQVWAGTHVTDTVLRVCVQEIRAALGDTAAESQYVETVRPQGYRFLVPGDGTAPPPATSGPIVVGRQRDVEALEGWFQRAAHGDRQLVFVSGEAGIGKTTVLDLVLARLAAESRGTDRARPVRRVLWGRGNPTCPCWRRWASSAVGQRRQRSGQCCGTMRRCGWCNSQGW